MKIPDQIVLEGKYLQLEKDYSDLKDKYDLLCAKLKRNANEERNKVDDGDKFLRNYGKGAYWS